MGISQRDSRTLSGTASRMGANVNGGKLTQQDGQFFVNKTNITALLESLVDENVLVMVGQINEEKIVEVKTCLTCGREYTESECPHCARVRSRLRP